MNLEQISDNAEKSLEQMAKLSFGGKLLEDVNSEALQVTEETLDDHVAIQPSAIAFFSSQQAAAARILDRMKVDYDFWKKRKFLEVRKSNPDSKEKKYTVSELEAMMVIANEAELKDWLDRLGDAQRSADTLKSMYDGWKQKGFSLREFAKLKEDEYHSSGSISARVPPARPSYQQSSSPPEKEPEESMEDKARRVREIMNRKKGITPTSTETETNPT